MKVVEEIGISKYPWRANIGIVLSAETVDTRRSKTVCDCLSFDSIEADARLIAAAPELYEALRSAVIQMCHDCPECDYADGDYVCGEGCDKKGSDKCFVRKWRDVLSRASGEEAK